ncbi:MAG TPA: M20/M25/M40 family metallo-hydrolase [Povalibacter sp.]|nr:M20/M25/M40 family metallo-hydrolase [Povalibacter sp.]
MRVAGSVTRSFKPLVVAASLATLPLLGQADELNAHQQLTHDIYKELVEINTTASVGDTAKASQAMAAHLKAAGFSDQDVQAFESGPKRGNMVARLRGTGKRKPLLLLAHIDVVEAKREDWTTDPFELVEKDGYFYGRGTGDDKYMAAAYVANLIRYKQEGYRPDRDIIVALTTDEEISDRDGRGISWLLKHHRDLIDAELALNEGGGVGLKDGKPVSIGVQTSEKVFQSYHLEVRNPGGHSSLPTKDNAIYHLSQGLTRLAAFDFPVMLNETTRAYFNAIAAMESGQLAADMKAVTQPTPDPEVVTRLSAKPNYNAQLRTTCVATRLEGGHADNALPQLARATVNCRVLPGHPLDDVQQTLQRVVADDQIKITPVPRDSASPPSPLDPALMRTIEKLSKQFWPGAPLVPIMSAGATDGRFLRNAGIPTYGHSGLASDIFDVRAHGRDERVLVKSFYQGQEYLYRLVKALAGGK